MDESDRKSAPPPRAVLMDLDGTLYSQRPLRLRMLRELALEPYRQRSFVHARETVRRLRVFRQVREELRALGRASEPLELLQYARSATRLGCDSKGLRATVEEWIHRRPLRYLRGRARAGLADFLDELHSKGIPVGVFSDYPVGEKLAALGLRERFQLELCATDAEINAFKPHPAGFLLAAERFGLRPSELLYVGDRIEVDAAGAKRAGMPCAILGRREGEADGACACRDVAALRERVWPR